MSSARASAALRRGRRLAESMMILRCRIDRVTGETTDRVTGKSTPLLVTVYEGRCKITSYEGYEQEADVAGSATTTQRLSIHLPVGKFNSHVGDVVTITRSPLDDRLVGASYRLAQQAPFRTFATADRIFIDAIAN